MCCAWTSATNSTFNPSVLSRKAQSLAIIADVPTAAKWMRRAVNSSPTTPLTEPTSRTAAVSFSADAKSRKILTASSAPSPTAPASKWAAGTCSMASLVLSSWKPRRPMLVHMRTTLAAEVFARSASSVTDVSSSSSEPASTTSATRRSAGENDVRCPLMSWRTSVWTPPGLLSVMSVNLRSRHEPTIHQP